MNRNWVGITYLCEFFMTFCVNLEDYLIITFYFSRELSVLNGLELLSLGFHCILFLLLYLWLQILKILASIVTELMKVKVWTSAWKKMIQSNANFYAKTKRNAHDLPTSPKVNAVLWNLHKSRQWLTRMVQFQDQNTAISVRTECYFIFS